MTALSGVGVAASVGLVWAPLSELNIAADASTTSAVNKPFPRPIAISARNHRQLCKAGGGDHRSAHAACKRKLPRFTLAPRNVIHVTPGHGLRSYCGAGSFFIFFKARHKARQMSLRRKAYWWFWFVVSGRFVATFLSVQRGNRRGCTASSGCVD
jgi:hypothetical protein